MDVSRLIRNVELMSSLDGGVGFVLQTYHYLYTCRTRLDSDSSPCRGDHQISLLLRQK